MNKIARKRIIQEKEIEQLEWECLMRSDKFMAVWKWALARKSNPSMPLPEQFKPIRNSDGIKITSPILSVLVAHKYVLLMNPENATFDEYLAIKKECLDEWRISGEFPTATLEAVEDCSKIILEYINIAANSVRKEKKREPSVEELKDSLSKWISDNGYQTFLKITQRKFTFNEVDEIMKQIYCILKKRIPRKRFVKDEMERYLRVYDQRINKGIRKKWKDVCRELYPKINFAEKRLELISDFKKAKRMIERIENNMHL